jgi:FkbM family methyltransferase
MPQPIYSQYREDQLLADHFHGRSSGYYVEVGAYDGIYLSNTYYFELVGWTGLLIEANPDKARACAQARPRSTTVHAAVVAPGSPPIVDLEVVEGLEDLSGLRVTTAAQSLSRRLIGGYSAHKVEVPAATLDELLEAQHPPVIDFVSIDIEDSEWEALKGFALGRWNPELVIIESHHRFPQLRLLRYMHSAGYVWLRTTGVNEWFIRERSQRAHHNLLVLVLRCYAAKISAPLRRRLHRLWR